MQRRMGFSHLLRRGGGLTDGTLGCPNYTLEAQSRWRTISAEGQVRVEWSCAADGRLVLRWTEAGGPPLNPPTREGFGAHLIEAMIRGHEGWRRAAQLARRTSRVRNRPSDVRWRRTWVVGAEMHARSLPNPT
jgi:hypothetical protein